MNQARLCEERSDEAIQRPFFALIHGQKTKQCHWIASLRSQ